MLCHIFIYPQVGLNRYEVFFCWKQNKIFGKILVTKQLIVAIDLHSVKNKKKIKFLYELPLELFIFWYLISEHILFPNM